MNEIIENNQDFEVVSWRFRPNAWIGDIVLSGSDLVSVLKLQCAEMAMMCGQKSPLVHTISIKPLMNLRSDGEPRYEVVISGQNLQTQFSIVFLVMDGDDELDRQHPEGLTLSNIGIDEVSEFAAVSG
jgi:hypothetical protein